MKITIQKFGGSSLATIDSRENIAHKVKEARDRSINPVIVVSAMGRKGDPYATDTLIGMLEAFSPSPRNLDLLMACGEIISSVIIASYLKYKGLDAVPLTGGQAGIMTDNHYGNANIKDIDTKLMLNILKEGKIPVVAGFQGITQEGNITTLGRGGSDVTASIIGEALKADSIEIYTDVDGVMTADPRLMPSAKVLSAIDYNEVLELAEYGAKVIHPRAIEISMRSNIPLYIKNASTDSPGTLITNYNKINLQKTLRFPVVTGIAHISNRAQIRVKTQGKDVEFFDPLFFTEIANKNISIDLINLFPQEKVFIIDSQDINKVEEILKENKYEYKIIDNCCKVTAIGSGMRGVPGVMARIVSALHREDIQILQTADSHTTISCLVNEEDTRAAIRVLHEEFNLG